jgi:acetyl esterase
MRRGQFVGVEDGTRANSDVRRAVDAPSPSDETRRYLELNGDDDDPDYDPLRVRQKNNRAGVEVRGLLRPVASVRDVHINGVSVRRYVPADPIVGPRLGVVWIHGGGWMHGDLEVYEGLARALANDIGGEVIAVDYRLAPEHPFPAGLDDVWKVVLWAVNEFGSVVVAGDSSGGNIAAAAALKARDAGVSLAAQLLIYPVLDADETDFKKDFRTRYAGFVGQEQFGRTTYDRIRWIWDVYVPDPALRASPFANPMRADELTGVAPAVIVTAEHDILRGEGEAYAIRLREDGVPVELLNSPGQIHGFMQMRAVLSESPRALARAAEAVRRIIAHHPPAAAESHP